MRYAAANGEVGAFRVNGLQAVEPADGEP